MSSYLPEMNTQVWWMIDVGLSDALEDCSQTQAQKKFLYLKSHASNALSSALSEEIKDEIEMEYDLLERANLLWKVLEHMFGSSDDKRSSSTKLLENVSSSSIHIDQDQEEQSSVQRKELKSTSLGKPDCLVSQTGTSGFSRIETTLAEKDDFSMSSSDIDDDDDADDEYDDQELLLEFKKLISKHIKLQKRHEDILYSHKELIDSCIARISL
jgi:hypothetical protein